jgi:LmbE family N-acetylglucosaminyl deacetylase
MHQTIAVVAAHPDDEVLGCGATMAKHAAAGDTVNVLILAEGATSRDGGRNNQSKISECEQLQAAGRRASELLGVATIEFAGFPDNRMDGVDFLDVVKRVELFIHRYAPDVIYTHFRGDMNLDHAITQRAVATALRPTPGQKFSRLLHFEIPSSTEWGAVASGEMFSPNWFEDVSPYVEKKHAALDAYVAEMRDFPHPRSNGYVDALAKLRGATVGVLAAEAFVLGWQINRMEL